MPVHEIVVKTTDDPRGLQEATESTIQLTDALGKLLEQAKRKEEYAAAKNELAGMTAEQKEAALAAHRLAAEQEKAAAETKRLEDAARAQQGVIPQLRLAWTELNSAVMLGQTVWRGAQSLWQETGGRFYQLAMQTKELTFATGASAQEASTLIAVMDDMGVEFGDVQRAIEAAIRNGNDPNLEGLIAMTEQYQAIQDPMERSRFLMEAFGRSGMEVAAFMQLSRAEIRALAEEAAASGQVLDGLAMAQADSFRQTEDAWNDAWGKIKLSVGSTVLPIVTDVMNAQLKYNETVVEQGKWWATLPGISQIYTLALAREEAQARKTTEAEAGLNNELAETAKVGWQASEALGGLTLAQMRQGIRSTTALGYSDPNYYHSWTGARAGGGNVSGGGAYIVNEPGAGPEVLILGGNQSGYILNHQQAQTALGAGGGTPIQVIVPYSPVVGLADQYEAQTRLQPYIQAAVLEALRQAGVVVP